MLTEIEWWGGLLLIWLSLSIYTFYLGYKEDRQKIGIDVLASYVAFVCAAGVFALYFYPLESLLFQKIYAAVIVIGILMLLIMNVWPSPEGETQEIDDTEDEEIGLIFNICLLYTSPSPRD